MYFMKKVLINMEQFVKMLAKWQKKLYSELIYNKKYLKAEKNLIQKTAFDVLYINNFV